MKTSKINIVVTWLNIFNISQIKGKESENSYQELKRSQKGQAHTNTMGFGFFFSSSSLVILYRDDYIHGDYNINLVILFVMYSSII